MPQSVRNGIEGLTIRYTLDGIQPLMKCNDIEGESLFTKFIKDRCTYNSEVVEYYILDIKGIITLHVGTRFSSNRSKYTDVYNDLNVMVHNIQRCQECIMQKNNVCIYKSQDEPM